jgi:hypothetical protein
VNTQAPRRYERNNIVFLCQECRGDLEPKPRAGSVRCFYECQSCGLTFTYGSAGWERAEPSFR